MPHPKQIHGSYSLERPEMRDRPSSTSPPTLAPLAWPFNLATPFTSSSKVTKPSPSSILKTPGSLVSRVSRRSRIARGSREPGDCAKVWRGRRFVRGRPLWGVAKHTTIGWRPSPVNGSLSSGLKLRSGPMDLFQVIGLVLVHIWLVWRGWYARAGP